MKEMHYDEMSKLWDETFPENTIVFSMYTLNGENDDLVTPEVDFTSKEPLVTGDFTLIIPNCNYPNYIKAVTGVDLTWEKLVDALSEFNDRHHIFLEDVTIDNKIVTVFLGS